jgi:hypothetical protein
VEGLGSIQGKQKQRYNFFTFVFSSRGTAGNASESMNQYIRCNQDTIDALMNADNATTSKFYNQGRALITVEVVEASQKDKC